MKTAKPALIFLSFRAFTLLSFAAYVLLAGAAGNWSDFFNSFKDALYSWDSWIYASIVEKGYDEPFKCAFFPLFPLLVRSLSLIFNSDAVLTAYVISNAACMAGVIFFYNLVKEEYSEKTALYSSVFFMAAPTTLFYTSVYTESLFFMLAVLFFLLLKRKMWLAAAIVAAFASGTRNVGMFLMPALVLAYLLEKSGKGFSFKNLISLAGKIDLKICLLAALSLLGLFAYMWFLKTKYNDPLFFYRAAAMWPERSGFIFPFWDFLMHIKNFTVQFQQKVTYDRVNLCFVYFSLALLLTVWGIKRLRPSHGLFLLLVIAILAVQPRLISISRYISSTFPVWILLSLFTIERKNSALWFIMFTGVMLVWQLYINFRWYLGMWVS
jgi:hypothetical protein